MKRLTSIIAIALVCSGAFAQTKEKAPKYSPQAGDFSIGLSINPMAAANYQPKNGDFLGEFITTKAGNPQQMFMVGQPLVSVRMKYMISEKLAFKATVGFSGSQSNYREYVKDDYICNVENPKIDAKTIDAVNASVNGGAATIGLEGFLGKGALRFIFGGSLYYAIGGGHINFNYGNKYAPYNGFNPTTMWMTTKDAANSLNEFTSPVLGITNGRPLCRNTIGVNQQVGLMVDAGLECFVYDRISVGLTASIVPIAFGWQGQTYSVYEGYSTISQDIQTWNKLVSPGSRALTYGTDNLAINISVNYYF